MSQSGAAVSSPESQRKGPWRQVEGVSQDELPPRPTALLVTSLMRTPAVSEKVPSGERACAGILCLEGFYFSSAGGNPRRGFQQDIHQFSRCLF